MPSIRHPDDLQESFRLLREQRAARPDQRGSFVGRGAIWVAGVICFGPAFAGGGFLAEGLLIGISEMSDKAPSSSLGFELNGDGEEELSLLSPSGSGTAAESCAAALAAGDGACEGLFEATHIHTAATYIS